MKECNLFLFFLFLIFSASPNARQVNVSSIGWSIEIPKIYSLVDSTNENGRMLLRFKRSPIDSDSEPVSPNVGIILDNVPENISLERFAEKYMSEVKKKWRVEKCDSICIPNSLCFCGSYPELKKSRIIRHTVYVVYQKITITGIQIIFDSTDSVFKDVKEEFIKIISSIQGPQ